MKRDEIDSLLAQLDATGDRRRLREMSPEGKYITVEGRKYLNLSSNDYLGLTEDTFEGQPGQGGTALQREFLAGLGDAPFMMSNPSSRLMGGNSIAYEMLEQAIASLYTGDRKALVLSSGYAVNAGALAALTAKGDLLIADKLSHASLMDGLRVCQTDFVRFRHNDMQHLEDILRKNRGAYKNVWVVTESVFSMDGDTAPLREIVELKRKYNLQIFLDEAHSFGLYGANGAGLACESGLAEEMDVIVAPLGKALASTGGFILTDASTRELLVNRMRTLIYSTAMPDINLLWSKFLIERLPGLGARRQHLRQLAVKLTGSPGTTQIVPIITGDNARAIEMAEHFRRAGFWVTAIRHPTVPKGRERVRVTLNAAITDEEIDSFKAVWAKTDRLYAGR